MHMFFMLVKMMFTGHVVCIFKKNDGCSTDTSSDDGTDGDVLSNEDGAESS